MTQAVRLCMPTCTSRWIRVLVTFMEFAKLYIISSFSLDLIIENNIYMGIFRAVIFTPSGDKPI